MQAQRQRLADYIVREWETCHRLRAKIDWEGDDYFYDSYTHVPVSREMFKEFCRNTDCYCETPGGCCDSQDEEEKERCTCLQDTNMTKMPCCYFPLCEYCYAEQVCLECEQCVICKRENPIKSCSC